MIKKNTAEHILNTSSNLLGFCLFIVTAFHISNYSEISKIDESSSIIALLLISSSLFSFFSIKSNSESKGKLLETIAAYLFVLSLIGILIVILMLLFNYLH